MSKKKIIALVAGSIIGVFAIWLGIQVAYYSSDFLKDFWRALLLHLALAKSRVRFALRSLQNNLVLLI